MPIFLTDALGHNANNPTAAGYALVDANEVSGGVRKSVSDFIELSDLITVQSANAIGVLSQHSTIVYVENTSPLVEAENGFAGATVSIDISGTATAFKADAESETGKFYVLTDINGVKNQDQPNASFTVTGDPDAETPVPYAAVPSAWTVMDDLVGGSDGDGIADYSGVTFNDDAATIVTAPLVNGGSTLAFTFPTFDDVAAVFDQGNDGFDSQIELVGVSAADTKRFKLKSDAQLQGNTLRLGGEAQAAVISGGGLDTILQVGSATDNTLYQGKASYIYTDFTVDVNDASDAAYLPSLAITSTNGIVFGGTVASATTTDDGGEITAQHSLYTLGGLASDQLSVMNALVADSSGQVFKKTLGAAAFAESVITSAVETLQERSDESNFEFYDAATGGAAASSGDLYMRLSDSLQIGTDDTAGSVVVGTSAGFSNDLANFVRVHGDVTIDGDLTVSGSQINITETDLTVEDAMISVAVLRDSGGAIEASSAHTMTLQGSTVGAGIEAFHGADGTDSANNAITNLNNARPYIAYDYPDAANQYGQWNVVHGYTPEYDGNGALTGYGNAIIGKILSSQDVRVVPGGQQDDDSYKYHDDLSASPESEDSLKFIATPYGLRQSYERTDSFTYTPLGGAESSYDQTYKRRFARSSVVTASFGAAGTTAAPRPSSDGAIRIYHGLDVPDGYVHVIGVVAATPQSESGLPPIGSTVHPKVKSRAADGTLGTGNEYKNSCDVFVNGAVQNDIIKFFVIA